MKRILVTLALLLVIAGQADGQGMCPAHHVTATESAPISISEYDALALNVRDLCEVAQVTTTQWDMAGGLKLPGSTSTPGTCAVREVYFDTDATAGSNVYLCTASNTWTQIAGGASGSAGGDLTGTYPNPTVAANSVALTTDTTGSYAAGDAEAGNATGVACTTCVDAGDIAADAVTEPKLKLVDSPSDEECLTYESTAGDFEWQACGTGTMTVEEQDGTPSVGSVTKIKVSNGTLTDNTGGVVSVTTGSGGGSGGAPYNQYDPDKEPASAGTNGCLDEFDGTGTCSWSWGNQGTSTATTSLDSVLLTFINTTGSETIRCYMVAAPASDFTVAALVRFNPTTATATQLRAGVALLEGTLATPTKIWLNGIYSNNSLTTSDLSLTSWTSYAGAGGAIVAQWSNNFITQQSPKWYYEYRYNTTANTAAGWYSPVDDGKVWESYGTGGEERTDSLSTDPAYAGICVNNGSTGNIEVSVDWFRLLTTAGGIAGETSD